jgi:hypothetical protein
MAGEMADLKNVREIRQQDIIGVDGQLRITKAGDMTVPILDWKDKVNRWPLKALHTPTLGPVSLLAFSPLLEAGYEAHFTSTTIEIHRPNPIDQ